MSSIICDAVIVYCSKDKHTAVSIISRINKLKAGDTQCTVRGYESVMEDIMSTSVVDVIERSLEVWILITDDFILDKSMEPVKNTILEECTRRRDVFVVPVFDKPKHEFANNIPYGLIAFKGMILSDRRFFEKNLKRFGSSSHLGRRREMEARLAARVAFDGGSAKTHADRMNEKVDRILQHLNMLVPEDTTESRGGMPQYLDTYLQAVRAEHSTQHSEHLMM